ncbi:hypothetical protein J437_LFUL015543 [Ladona fulva]|uniref:Uncharacterized protein n=1 Tax=Ladona fulva TaxID=123851 RepID=A0A8K0P7D7_LADFU|nr:hypothetical protein J437_LFUL015543 [Ladona fulva]
MSIGVLMKVLCFPDGRHVQRAFREEAGGREAERRRPETAVRSPSPLPSPLPLPPSSPLPSTQPPDSPKLTGVLAVADKTILQQTEL